MNQPALVQPGLGEAFCQWRVEKDNDQPDSGSHSDGPERRPVVNAMSSAPVLSPELRSTLVAMVRKRVPADEVEDIVQATLADAFASPHAPPDAESFRRWVFGVAKNKVIDYHRRAIRETFEVPDLAGGPAPHSEVDMLRWAERNLPPGDENKTTLDWMLREGEGEKLEWIAESEKMPAPRVRQRVSRLRRHLKDHWKKEIALLAAVGVLLTGMLLLLRPKAPQPIANEDVARAEELRKDAFTKCLASDWKPCVDKLDEAKRLDPAGDTRPAVKQARDNADNATRLAPAPSAAPTTMNAPPAPSSSAPDLSKPSPKPHPSPSAFSTETPTPAPTITTPPAIMKPTKSIGNSDSDFVQGKESMAPLKKAPAKKTATPDFGS